MIFVDCETFHAASRVITFVGELFGELQLCEGVFGEDAPGFRVDLKDAAMIAIKDEQIPVEKREVRIMGATEREIFGVNEKGIDHFTGGEIDHDDPGSASLIREEKTIARDGNTFKGGIWIAAEKL